MKRAFLAVVVSLLSLTGCPSSPSMCEKAVDNIMAKCKTCFATSSSSSMSSSRGSASCKQALMGMCQPGPSSRSASSSASSNPDAFLACVAAATSCDGILLCN